MGNRFGRERLLYRIGISEYREQFLLKGVMLFALWYDMPHRPTRDMDLLGFGPGELFVLERVFREITQQTVDDGLRFAEMVTAEETRKEADYAGARGRLLVTLGQTFAGRYRLWRHGDTCCGADRLLGAAGEHEAPTSGCLSRVYGHC